MTSVELQALLRKYLSSGQKAARWLERSQNRCQGIQLATQLNDDNFDSFENLTSRFARLSDILIQKLFRLIDQILLESQGSIIDTINRAEKRGLGDAAGLRNIRELRNAIAHEYTEEELLMLFAAVQKKSPELLASFRAMEIFINNHKIL